ncbi:nickel pincer cofactor biosynthesis protein LarB [Roseospira marina]|uniref:Nickel pincer cofactor biosynthesis protein LarB n=1 Tax=Roseospira marina TaxID=140057 RepID=A0A5M6ICJ5_9PROT|nr:nickel pincer cofactor biosynthesis protein LarB [Roseospira marina]KAA5605994.1 nickel pincer cofactor biosynthesis protein LarB [Roseospira marina]MBB4313153.1 hypothetical protein [Roseospira marina]MBB5086106.1 hypothetical protein [Roseospira marina]
MPDVRFDADRVRRIGLPEAVFCTGKTPIQIATATGAARAAHGRCLLTRLDAAARAALPQDLREALDYDPLSRTAVLGDMPSADATDPVAIVTGGTADLAVATEALRTLRFSGCPAVLYADVGVAGLWRLMEIRESLAAFSTVILVAGMEGALFTVAGGLLPGLLIAVPTSVGYGVAAGGQVALNAALSSCAPGLLVTNIDNGYGAACAALRARGARS